MSRHICKTGKWDLSARILNKCLICDRQREDEKRRKKKGRSGSSASAGFPSPNQGYSSNSYVGTAAPSYTSRDRKPSYSDLSGQFNNLDLTNQPRKYSTSEAGPPIGGGYGGSPPYGGPHSRPYAATGPHISAYSNPSPNMRAADVLPPSGPPSGYPTSPYTSTKPSEPIARAPSPYGYAQPPRSRATTPIPGVAPSFPQPRSRAASPVPGYAQPRSRAASPMPGGMPLPPEASFDRHNQPSVPECFGRPMNTALSFPAFDPIKIQEMDEFLERLPKLPLVLQSHDVTHHDWIRLTQVDIYLYIRLGAVWLTVICRICLLPGLVKCLFPRRGPRTRPNVQTLWLSSSMLGTLHFLCPVGLKLSSTRVAPGSQDPKLASLIYPTNTMKRIQTIRTHLRTHLQRTSALITLSQWVYMAALTQYPWLHHQLILLSRVKPVEGVARKKSVAARRSA